VEVIPIPAKATTYMQVFHNPPIWTNAASFKKPVQVSSTPPRFPSMSAAVVHLAGITDQEFDWR
jgi:hypothetical protein